MIFKLALLSVLSNESAAFTAANNRRGVSNTAHFMTNDFDKYYDIDVDRHGNIQGINDRHMSRRNALSKGFSVAALSAAAILSGSSPATAVAEDISFSKDTTSAVEIGKATMAEQFIREETKGKSAQVEGLKSVSNKSIKSDSKSIYGSNLGRIIASIDVPIGAYPVATVLTLATAAKTNAYKDESSETSRDSIRDFGRPAAVPYGLTNAGRNSWPENEPKPVTDEPASEEEPQTSPWDNQWFTAPVPYGMQNQGGNPFIEQVEEYCEGGQVTPQCTDTIKAYVNDLSSTGAVATTGEAESIAEYLDTLGDNPTESDKKAGAAFTSYLDAVSTGAAPPPKSAKAVKTYLNTLNGGAAPSDSSPVVSSKPKVGMPSPVVTAPEATPLPPPAPIIPTTPSVDSSEFDGRLTFIEGRVADLERKVDNIPDQVFEKIEAWQSSQNDKLSDVVKGIVTSMESSKPVRLQPTTIIVESPAVQQSSATTIGPESVQAVQIGDRVISINPSTITPPPPASTPPDSSGPPMPQASAPPKKGGWGKSAASWKNSSPKRGGGYLDNMNP